MLVPIIKFQLYLLEITSIEKMKLKMAGNLCFITVRSVTYTAVAAGRETVMTFHVIGRPLLYYSRTA